MLLRVQLILQLRHALAKLPDLLHILVRGVLMLELYLPLVLLDLAKLPLLHLHRQRDLGALLFHFMLQPLDDNLQICFSGRRLGKLLLRALHHFVCGFARSSFFLELGLSFIESCLKLRDFPGEHLHQTFVFVIPRFWLVPDPALQTASDPRRGLRSARHFLFESFW
jgi:hypothetical protein